MSYWILKFHINVAQLFLYNFDLNLNFSRFWGVENICVGWWLFSKNMWVNVFLSVRLCLCVILSTSVSVCGCVCLCVCDCVCVGFCLALAHYNISSSGCVCVSECLNVWVTCFFGLIVYLLRQLILNCPDGPSLKSVIARPGNYKHL